MEFLVAPVAKLKMLLRQIWPWEIVLPNWSDFEFSSLKQMIRQDTRVFWGFVSAITLMVGIGGYSLYLHGRDGRLNLADGHYSIAFDQYIGPAKAGDLQAQTVIGDLYYLGLGVEQDGYKSAQWYLKGALKGYVPAQLNMAKLYLVGRGVPLDVGKAVGWYRLASQAGSKLAVEHVKYIMSRNMIVPMLIEKTIHDFHNLEIVNDNYDEQGESSFLLKD